VYFTRGRWLPLPRAPRMRPGTRVTTQCTPLWTSGRPCGRRPLSRPWRGWRATGRPTGRGRPGTRLGWRSSCTSSRTSLLRPTSVGRSEGGLRGAGQGRTAARVPRRIPLPLRQENRHLPDGDVTRHSRDVALDRYAAPCWLSLTERISRHGLVAELRVERSKEKRRWTTSLCWSRAKRFSSPLFGSLSHGQLQGNR
jgi:hypothetical protein